MTYRALGFGLHRLSLAAVCYMAGYMAGVGGLGTAHSYQLRRASDGGVLIWDREQIDVTVNTSGVEGIPGAGDAVRTGFVTWLSSGVPHSVRFKDGTGGGSENTVKWVFSDWEYDSSIVGITVSTYQSSTKIVKHSDVLLNAAQFEWTTTPEQEKHKYDVQTVMLHEAGHFFGLGHEPNVADAVMAPYTSPGFRQSGLSDDDRNGIVALIDEINSRTDRNIPTDPIPTSGTFGESEEFFTEGGCNAAGRPAGTSALLPMLLFLLGYYRSRRCACVRKLRVSIAADRPADRRLRRNAD